MTNEYIKKAIEMSIEGGYKYQGNYKCDYTVKVNSLKVYMNDPEDTKLYIPFNDLFLSPDWWQCLGKQLGWRGKLDLTTAKPHWNGDPEWLYRWHCFIDHLALGKDINEFFKLIIKE